MTGLTAREERLVLAATELLDALADLKERGFFRDRRPGDPVLTAQLGPLSVAWVALAEAVGAVVREAALPESRAPGPARAASQSLPPVNTADVGRVQRLETLAGGPVEVAFQVTPGGVSQADLVTIAAPVMDVVRAWLRARLDNWSVAGYAQAPARATLAAVLPPDDAGLAERYDGLGSVALLVLMWMAQTRAGNVVGGGRDA